MGVPESWWPWLSLAELMWVIGLSVWILFERRTPGSTLAWILGLSLLPLLGIAVYFLIGPKRFDRRKVRHAEAQRVAHRGALKATDTDTDADTGATPAPSLVRQSEVAAGPPARLRPGVVSLLLCGDDKYAALEDAIAAADHHIHLEYYKWHPDATGARVRDLLAARAADGVEVRVLIDGFGSARAGDRFWRPLRDAGGRISRFNRITLWRLHSRLANFRTHRKIVVIDGRVGFTGGMNVTDVHSVARSGDAAWRDTHLRVEGAAVRGLQMVFSENWYYCAGERLEARAYYPRADLDDRAAMPTQVIASGPDENLDAIHKLYLSAIAAARRRVFLTTPYFVPDESVINALGAAALRGVDVRVLVPADNDERLVAAASRSYYPDLLDLRVRIFEYGPPMLHAKTLAVDDDLAVVGTANVDTRSFKLNFEVVVACFEPTVCSALADSFADDLRRAVEVTRETIAGYSLPRRLGQNFARLLSSML